MLIVASEPDLPLVLLRMKAPAPWLCFTLVLFISPIAAYTNNCWRRSACLDQPNNTTVCFDNQTAVVCWGGTTYSTHYCNSPSTCQPGLGCVCPPCDPSRITGCSSSGTCTCKRGWYGTYCNRTFLEYEEGDIEDLPPTQTIKDDDELSFPTAQSFTALCTTLYWPVPHQA